MVILVILVICQGQRKNYGDQNLSGGIAVSWGYSEIFAPPPKRIMWGQLRIIQGRHLKIGGAGNNSNMRGHTEFLGGFEKIEGARLSGGLLQRGVSNRPFASLYL